MPPASKPTAPPTGDSQLHLSTIVSARSGEPFVIVEWEGLKGQWTPTEARQHAYQVLEAAEAAEVDAFLLSFFRDKFKLDVARAAVILKEYRAWRDAHTETTP